jgi:Fe-S oxidoreductase
LHLVCPANITGKMLSPVRWWWIYAHEWRRKVQWCWKTAVIIAMANRCSRLHNRRRTRACTTCNACAQECPLNIDHPNSLLKCVVTWWWKKVLHRWAKSHVQ